MVRAEIPLVLTVFVIQISAAIGGRQLDEYILHYEELHYDTQSLHDSHMRHKRSIDKNVNVKLDAFNRTFHLELVQNSAVFAPDFILELGSKKEVSDLSFLYTGKIKGDHNSQVHGAIIEGIFRGTVHMPAEREVYHVEKSQALFPDKPVFHSVIYKESDMNLDPFKERREKDRAGAQTAGTCGYTKAMQWMKETVHTEKVEINSAKRSSTEGQEVYSGDHNKYTLDTDAEDQPRRRTKRATLGDKNSCVMSLTSDLSFWKHFLSRSKFNRDVAKDEILAFFANHLSAINKIYGETTFSTFNNDMSYTGVQFGVQKIKIITLEDCYNVSNSQLASNLCGDTDDVSKFLNTHSLLNHDDVCLAYVFTYRDFSDGTLGLAWQGASSLSAGGVCERNKWFVENGRNIKKSLNTGVVTILDYGRKVASRVSQIAFAHQVGHSFGSPHDFGPECAPYETGTQEDYLGNYIMSGKANIGDHVRNSEFSSCSKDNITRVLDAVLHRPHKYNCFKKSGPFCGNGIFEPGEECDCGFYGDCQDDCCIPRNKPDTAPGQYCKLAPGKTCSPSQGPCCNSECYHVIADKNFTCRYQHDCAAESKCDGTHAYCPVSTQEPDGTFCHVFSHTCINGECAGSLCDRFNWTTCFPTGPSETDEEREHLCKLGCRANISGVDTGCILSDDTDVLTNKYPDYKQMVDDVIAGREAVYGMDTENAGIQLSPGSWCNNYRGYCDVFKRCRDVYPEGPQAMPENIIFN